MVLKLPANSRYFIMLLAFVSPMPGSVISCSSVAVFRFTTAETAADVRSAWACAADIAVFRGDDQHLAVGKKRGLVNAVLQSVLCKSARRLNRVNHVVAGFQCI